MVRDADFRGRLVNEVHELMAFLQMRLSEAGSSQGLGGSHDLLDSVSSAALQQWLQVLASSSTVDYEQAIARLRNRTACSEFASADFGAFPSSHLPVVSLSGRCEIGGPYTCHA